MVIRVGGKWVDGKRTKLLIVLNAQISRMLLSSGIATQISCVLKNLGLDKLPQNNIFPYLKMNLLGDLATIYVCFTNLDNNSFQLFLYSQILKFCSNL